MKKQRIIIEVHGGIRLEYAIEHVQAVVRGGLVSGAKHRRQHCYHSVFKNGVRVSVFKRGDVKSERFVVYKGQ